LEVIDESPEGALPNDLPAQPAVFAPDYEPEEIAEIATKLRQKAGLPKEPTGLVADFKKQTKRSTRKATSRAKRAPAKKLATIIRGKGRRLLPDVFLRAPTARVETN
jgi:hypothetical protein